MVDARQLERWGIPLSRVPPGSIILNRVPTVWEIYHWHIIGGLLLLVSQTLLIATLLFNRRHRRLAEQNLAISEADRRVAVSDERNRMARDMHDTLAQGFTGVIVQLQAARDALAHGSAADTDAHVGRASELARQSLGEARRSIRALRPQALENGDLCTALDDLTKQMTAGTAFSAEFTTRGQARRLTRVAEENLLRIHQEIFTNALKHSGATSIKAVLRFDENAVSLEVGDDGRGFDSAMKHDGFGLIGIGERVKQMNGEFEVTTRAGAGTKIRVTLPAPAEANDTKSRQPLASEGQT
jgi:signal transduction histidine kinase